MFCSARETVKLLLTGDNSGGTLVGFMPLDRDLRTASTTRPNRDAGSTGGVVGGATEPDEGKPARHAPMRGGLEHAARQEQELREIDR